MLLDYEENNYPPYAFEDDDYKYCQSLGDVKILRMFKTYIDFVQQRYATLPKMAYKNFNPMSKQCVYTNESFYKSMTDLVHKLNGDPAHFISFVFEVWPQREHYAALVYYQLERSGIMYPSWTFIEKNADVLADEFNSIKDYKPKGFIPVDDFRGLDATSIMRRAERWCAAYDKTMEDYWLTPRHLFPPYLSYRELCCVDLTPYSRRIKAELGFSIRDLKIYLRALEEQQEQQIQKKYEHLNQLQKQGHLAFEAIEVLDYVADETEVEVDYEDPDTILSFLYGFGEEPEEKEGV